MTAVPDGPPAIKMNESMLLALFEAAHDLSTSHGWTHSGQIHAELPSSLCTPQKTATPQVVGPVAAAAVTQSSSDYEQVTITQV